RRRENKRSAHHGGESICGAARDEIVRGEGVKVRGEKRLIPYALPPTGFLELDVAVLPKLQRKKTAKHFSVRSHFEQSEESVRMPTPGGTWAGCTPRCLRKPLPPACRSLPDPPGSRSHY